MWLGADRARWIFINAIQFVDTSFWTGRYMVLRKLSQIIPRWHIFRKLSVRNGPLSFPSLNLHQIVSARGSNGGLVNEQGSDVKAGEERSQYKANDI